MAENTPKALTITGEHLWMLVLTLMLRDPELSLKAAIERVPSQLVGLEPTELKEALRRATRLLGQANAYLNKPTVIHGHPQKGTPHLTRDTVGTPPFAAETVWHIKP